MFLDIKWKSVEAKTAQDPNWHSLWNQKVFFFFLCNYLTNKNIFVFHRKKKMQYRFGTLGIFLGELQYVSKNKKQNSNFTQQLEEFLWEDGHKSNLV